jgi:hypothetical protein
MSQRLAAFLLRYTRIRIGRAHLNANLLTAECGTHGARGLLCVAADVVTHRRSIEGCA